MKRARQIGEGCKETEKICSQTKVLSLLISKYLQPKETEALFHPGWTLPKTWPMGCQAAALQGTRGSKLLCLLTERTCAPRRASISHSPVSKSLCDWSAKLLQGGRWSSQGKVSRRKQTPTSSLSEAPQQTSEGRRQSLRLPAQEQGHLYDFRQTHRLLSTSGAQVKDYYITVLWLVSSESHVSFGVSYFLSEIQLSSAAAISFLIHFTTRYLLSEIVFWYVSGWWIQ